MPTITTIIPLYNAAATAGDTVRSLLAQTHTDWNAIVVDDGSTDTSVREVDRAAAGDPRFTIIHQPNRGLAAARNTGLAHATGRYIHFLDSDDWLLPRGLETLLHAAESAGGGAACGPYLLRDASGADMGREMPTPVAPGDFLTLDDLLDGNRIAPHSHIVRRDLIAETRFDERLRVVEDLDMWLRLAACGGGGGGGEGREPVRWRAAQDPVAAYRLRPGSLSKNPRLMFDTVRAVLTNAYRATDFGPAKSVLPAFPANSPRATDPRSLRSGSVLPASSTTSSTPDRSPARLDRALRDHALMYASIAALQSAPDFTAADGLLSEISSRGEGSAARAAVGDTPAFGRAAFWATLFGLCIPPRDLAHTAHSWRPALASWWSACRARGLLTGDLDHAWQALADEAVDPAAIANSLLEHVGDSIVIAGYGRNGRALAREAARRGLSIEIRDDALAAAPANHAATGLPRIRPIDAPIQAGAAVIVTPLEDDAIVSRLPRNSEIRRWRDERARQTRSFLRSLPHPAAAA